MCSIFRAAIRFNETSNQTAYWHKSIGGYHAAKLRRYQELINFYLDDECQHLGKAAQADQAAADSAQGVASCIRPRELLNDYVASTLDTDSVTPLLNMLNMKWVILSGGNIALRNTHANGNAWFVNEVKFADNADAEIRALGNSTRNTKPWPMCASSRSSRRHRRTRSHRTQAICAERTPLHERKQ